MMFITITNRENNDIKKYSWHIGEKTEYIHNLDKMSDIFIQADCDELLYIISNFKNIPFHQTKLVQKWSGDLARFIIMNL